ncbi:hypothetical protein [Duganella sp. LjRoot269]|uniref:hypothetical protein n=1 Tax=Duganella sp. LjRoot269 TaxID=3342305 RepID=UPI003ECCEED2
MGPLGLAGRGAAASGQGEDWSLYFPNNWHPTEAPPQTIMSFYHSTEAPVHFSFSKSKMASDPSIKWWHAAPPIAALFYPFFLKGFSLLVDTEVSLATLMLAMAMSVPILAFFVAWDLGKETHPIASTVRLKSIAWLAVAAPPMFTADGVLTYMEGQAVSDITLWVIFWTIASVIALITARNSRTSVTTTSPNAKKFSSPRLRVAHGISAVAILVLFLAMHLTNHLAGAVSETEHRHLMDIFRVIYRSRTIEPLVVLLFLFQVLSGLVLLRMNSHRPADFYKSLQLASGGYLVFFILAHMNSVFIYARRFAGIKTDWNFATGAPTGLLHDSWNIRLVPHYYFGVFLIITHLVLAARVVCIAHGMPPKRANFGSKLGIVIGAAIAAVIMLGMTGLQISN